MRIILKAACGGLTTGQAGPPPIGVGVPPLLAPACVTLEQIENGTIFPRLTLPFRRAARRPLAARIHSANGQTLFAAGRNAVAFIARAARPHLPGIKRVGVKHEAILNFLLANPLVKMGDAAEHFKVSRAWLSLIVHSDVFQRKLRERQDIHFDHSILPAMEKVQLVADLALDRMLECLPYESDVGKLNLVADRALSRLGYGTDSGGGTQVNVQVNVDRSLLERAREKIGGGVMRPALEVQSESGSAREMQAGGGGAVGEADSLPALSPPSCSEST